MKFYFSSMFTLFLLLLFTGCRKDDPYIESKPVESAVLLLDNNWQIGYSKTNQLIPEDFQSCKFSQQIQDIVMCHPGKGQSGYYPYTGRNISGRLQQDPSNSWAARPGEFVMEGSNTGQYSILRYIVPASGLYEVTAVFAGVHAGLSSTDVYIVINGQPVFSNFIEGYGGDPSFHAITGTQPSVSYTNTIHLNQNDSISFAVGYGINKNHYNDTTGLIVSIEAV